VKSRFLLLPAAAIAFAAGLTLDLGAARPAQTAPAPSTIDPAVLKGY
jgi:hypothetical protein